MIDRKPTDAQTEGGVARDGSPVALYLALSGQQDAALVHNAVPAGVAILELGSGAGRVTRHLVTAGHAVTAVDDSAAMLAYLDCEEGVETVLADMATLDLSPRRWPVVLLASHLINDELGPAFLATAARHLTEKGFVLVERHEAGWVDTVVASTSHWDGVTIAICDIERPAPGTLRATMVYDVAGRRYEQRFGAYDVDDSRLVQLASDVGLSVDAWLDERRQWVRLVRP